MTAYLRANGKGGNGDAMASHHALLSLSTCLGHNPPPVSLRSGRAVLALGLGAWSGRVVLARGLGSLVGGPGSRPRLTALTHGLTFRPGLAALTRQHHYTCSWNLYIALYIYIYTYAYVPNRVFQVLAPKRPRPGRPHPGGGTGTSGTPEPTSRRSGITRHQTARANGLSHLFIYIYKHIYMCIYIYIYTK